MKFLLRILNFYINSSIHVGLSCYALVSITQQMFHISNTKTVANFAFFGTIVGYNFVKYDALARAKKMQMKSDLKRISIFSFGCLIMVGYYFFQLHKTTQIIGLVFLSITLLYTLPFFPNRKNARNWSGVKIYIVSLCWVGVTVVLPVMNAEINWNLDFYLIGLQRFILIFVLILIFEINDLAQDDPHLQTVPQQIGVKRTKQLGYLGLILHCCLSIFISNGKFQFLAFSLPLIFAIVIAIFLFFSNEKRSKYYTSFWVESLPIFWWLILIRS